MRCHARDYGVEHPLRACREGAVLGVDEQGKILLQTFHEEGPSETQKEKVEMCIMAMDKIPPSVGCASCCMSGGGRMRTEKARITMEAQQMAVRSLS